MNKPIKLTAQDLPKESIHPGAYLHDELEARQMTQRQLSERTGIPTSTISEIINGKRGISAKIAVQLEETLSVAADFWMRAQISYEITKVRLKHRRELKESPLPDDKKESLSSSI